MSQSTDQINDVPRKSTRRGRAGRNRPSKDSIEQIRKKRLNVPIDDNSRFSEKVIGLRKRVWEEWEEYTEASEIDSQDTWRQLCEDVPHATQEFCSFLEYYITSSKKQVPSLGPNEYEEERTVNSASTIQDVWCALVSVANDSVLRELRMQFPMQRQVYVLRYTTRGGHDAGPAGQVGRLIPKLAVEHGLSRSQLFEKTEMTLDDILMILKTVWGRASCIPCQPWKRLAFSGILLLGGIGGWRFESLKQLRYRDIKVAWLKDPKNPQKARCVATIRIHHAKWKADKIERDQTSSITLVPFKPVCLLSHIVAMAFFRNAFSTDFTTPEQILYPELEPDCSVSYIPLKWKNEMLDNHVFDLNYKSYWALWHRVLMVGGLRTKLKPYSVRVGAGNRLDGPLKPAIRSYVFGNTDAVFRKSYIPVDISYDLMGIAYGQVTGGNQETISFLHHAFTKRDESAPVYISEEEYKSFEDREDIKKWRQEREALPDRRTKEAKNLLSKIQYIKNVLEGKLLEKKRKEYFEHVDALRTAEQLAPYFIAEDGNHDIASKIVRYLRQTSIEDLTLIPGPDKIAMTKASPTRPTCFICFKDYTTRPGLTAHVQRIHSEVFEKPFHCPECRQKGQEILVPAGLPAWSNHTERFHGAKNSPRASKEPDRSAHCLLCKKDLTAVGFNLHLQKAHKRDFTKEFACPECLNQSLDLKVKDKGHWLLHVKQYHGGCHIPGAIFRQTLQKHLESCGQGAERDNNGGVSKYDKKRKLELEGDLACKRLKTGASVNLFDNCSEDSDSRKNRHSK
ncbi:unnamed protein product [Fusarium graminearum]|nr:unnamed protein product [Fusarium graminearum]